MLEIIIITIFVSTFLNLFLAQFKIPTIIGYITTGTIIAYSFELHDHTHNSELKEIAEFGVVFLMFTIGLEFSVNHLIKMKKAVFLYGGMQVVFTAVVFIFIANYFFNIEIKSSIIIGLALALSSTAIVLKILNENGGINKPYGRNVLGVLLFQDIAVIPILLMITIFSAKSGSITDLLSTTFINATILLISLFVVGKYLLEPFFGAIAKAKSNEIFISSILLVVIGSSYMAHAFGFSYSLGAFIAGMMIAETNYRNQVEADLIPFRDLLLGVFFITVGMQIDFAIIAEKIGIISMLLIAITIIKIIMVYGIFRLKSGSKNAIKTALSIFQLGEFALVVFELSFAKGLLEETLGQILIVTVIISMIITPFVLNHISDIVDIFDYSNSKASNDNHHKRGDLENHIILIGYGKLGRYISNLIQKEGLSFIVVELDIETVKNAKKQNIPIVFGNASQKHLLESLNIKKASSVIISIGNSHKLQHLCEVVNDLTYNAKTIVKVNTFEDKELLSSLNLSKIVVETEKTADVMFEEAVNCMITHCKIDPK